MANPYFSNSPNFGRSQPQAPSPYGQQGQQQWGAPSGATGTVDPQFQGIQDAYYGPSAGPAQTGRLSYDDVIMKTGTVLGAIVLTAALAWFLVPDSIAMPVMIVGALGAFVLGLVNCFKKQPSPALIMGYAVLEGLFLGVISRVFEMMWPGIVVQAVLATFITFGVTLALFRSGKVRVTPKFTKFLMIGLISYAVFGLVNLAIIVFFPDVGGSFGLREGGFGLLIGAVAVVLAAMTLIADFDQIQRGVNNGVPRTYAWSAAFGLALSLVWLYMEFLRILAIFRGD